MQMPLFNHLWFLWFLWWLVLAFGAVSALGSRLPSIRMPRWLILSPARYLWLIPLTMIPQWFMGESGASPIFGPDTSTGLLPIPHVFAYYAIFFGFGTAYFGLDDRSGRVGERWWLPLSVGLLVILPLGLALTEGWTGPAGYELAPLPRRLLSVALQAAYPWLITFGLMGLFQRVFPVVSPRMQYLSDSAYWLYLAHLPLVIAAQLAVKDWPIPALAKFLLIVTVVTSFLLWTYQTMVRYTWLGQFLNGPRARPAPGSSARSRRMKLSHRPVPAIASARALTQFLVVEGLRPPMPYSPVAGQRRLLQRGRRCFWHAEASQARFSALATELPGAMYVTVIGLVSALITGSVSLGPG